MVNLVMVVYAVVVFVRRNGVIIIEWSIGGKKMAFDKYITINDERIHSGQDPKTKEWYCKDLPSRSVEETELLIGRLNILYNKYNKKEKK